MAPNLLSDAGKEFFKIFEVFKRIFSDCKRSVESISEFDALYLWFWERGVGEMRETRDGKWLVVQNEESKIEWEGDGVKERVRGERSERERDGRSEIKIESRMEWDKERKRDIERMEVKIKRLATITDKPVHIHPLSWEVFDYTLFINDTTWEHIWSKCEYASIQLYCSMRLRN